MRESNAACNALAMATQGIVDPKRRLLCCWSRRIIKVLDSVFENVEVVDIRKAGPSHGPNMLATEVTVGIRKLMSEVWHVSIGILSTVIVEAAWIPRSVRRHHHVWKGVELIVRTGSDFKTWESIVACWRENEAIRGRHATQSPKGGMLFFNDHTTILHLNR